MFFSLINKSGVMSEWTKYPKQMKWTYIWDDGKMMFISIKKEILD